jgi:hypothetical protein
LPLPQAIQNAPELTIGLELYYGAFFDLDPDRPQSHGGLGPIPWSSIHSYAVAWALDEEQTDDLFYYVRQMDSAYLKWQAGKAEAKTGGK